MRTLVMGDIHGAWKALQQCLQRSQFDPENDQLIQLGDITDGQADVYRCVEELLRVRHLITIRGNHDDWFNHFLHTGVHPDNWRQGGAGTAISYLEAIGKQKILLPSADGYDIDLRPEEVPEKHRLFFERQQLYYLDAMQNCFVHAGFDRTVPFEGQPEETYMWDRKLWKSALSYRPTKKSSFKMATAFREIFIGHTPTQNWKKDIPMQAANIWNIDTGAGHDGKLTIMDIATKQYWQSDCVKDLYGPVRW